MCTQTCKNEYYDQKWFWHADFRDITFKMPNEKGKPFCRHGFDVTHEQQTYFNSSVRRTYIHIRTQTNIHSTIIEQKAYLDFIWQHLFI